MIRVSPVGRGSRRRSPRPFPPKKVFAAPAPARIDAPRARAAVQRSPPAPGPCAGVQARTVGRSATGAVFGIRQERRSGACSRQAQPGRAGFRPGRVSPETGAGVPERFIPVFRRPCKDRGLRAFRSVLFRPSTSPLRAIAGKPVGGFGPIEAHSPSARSGSALPLRCPGPQVAGENEGERFRDRARWGLPLIPHSGMARDGQIW